MTVGVCRNLVDRNVVRLLGFGHVRPRCEDISGAMTSHFPAPFVVEAAEIGNMVLEFFEWLRRFVECQFTGFGTWPPAPLVVGLT